MSRYRELPSYHYENASNNQLLSSAGKPLRDYKIYGNSVQNGTPSPDNPVEIQSVGDKVGDLFCIPVNVTGNTSKTTNIYLPEPLRKVGGYADYVDFVGKKCIRTNAEISSYNGESISGEYLSSTGALTEGAQIVYRLATPTETPITLPAVETVKNAANLSVSTTIQPSSVSWQGYVYNHAPTHPITSLKIYGLSSQATSPTVENPVAITDVDGFTIQIGAKTVTIPSELSGTDLKLRCVYDLSGNVASRDCIEVSSNSVLLKRYVYPTNFKNAQGVSANPTYAAKKTAQNVFAAFWIIATLDAYPNRIENEGLANIAPLTTYNNVYYVINDVVTTYLDTGSIGNSTGRIAMAVRGQALHNLGYLDTELIADYTDAELAAALGNFVQDSGAIDYIAHSTPWQTIDLTSTSIGQALLGFLGKDADATPIITPTSGNAPSVVLNETPLLMTAPRRAQLNENGEEYLPPEYIVLGEEK